MRVPVSWLRAMLPELAELPQLAELTAMLDDLGLVVEEVEHVVHGLDQVVVARVERIAPIEGADRIRLATVSAGADPVDVVCGAWNYEVGSLVAFAPAGTTLPNGMTIERRTLRGVVSNGMLCSARELGLGDDQAGLLLLEPSDAATPGAPVAAALQLVDDVVLDLSIEGNRPDAWCVEGVARDLAARLGRPFGSVAPPPLAATTDRASAGLAVSVAEPSRCGRLVVAVLEGVVVAPSPQWLARRLELCGMRPVNNVVDASNYAMLELGQPTHPYDLDELHGGLSVRLAREGERLVLLDGTEARLAEHSGVLGDTGEDLVICDGRDGVVGLAGIMGGEHSGIAPTTVRVALESAWFDPMTIARSAKRHRLRTEASARFERGCDWSGCARAAARVTELLALSCPDLAVVELHLVDGALPATPTIPLDEAAIRTRLGTTIGLDEAARLLGAIGFGVARDGDELTVTAPPGRPDVRPAPFGVADVVEEVARLHGYARIAGTVPTWPQPGGLAPQIASRRKVREALVGAGALECWTATMVPVSDGALLGDDRARVVVTNPMAAGEPALRTSLLPGLLSSLRRNVERRQGDVALFETGTVFTHPAHADAARVERGGEGGREQLKVPTEEERCVVVLGRPGDDAGCAIAVWREVADALVLEGVRLERDDDAAPPFGAHPTRYALLVDAASRAVLGHVGEVDPSLVARAVPTLPKDRRVGLLDVSLTALCDPALARRRDLLARVPSRFPSSDVDLAFSLPERVGVDDLKEVLATAARGLAESIRCFDAYRGEGVAEGQRSLAMRVRLVAEDRTLTEEELQTVRRAMIDAAAARLGAQLR